MISVEANDLVNKIIKSKTFGNSTTYANLLKFLVNCSLKKQIPKEITIASEIFGKHDFDPSQSTLIRVYVYNLRKKLTNYYESEGAKDKSRLTIPKGGYAVELIKHKEPYQKTTSYKKIVLAFSGLFLLSLITNLYFATKTNQNEPEVAQSRLWDNLLKSKRPKILVIGDLFVYSETHSVENVNRIVRNPKINSTEAFQEFALQNKNKDLNIESLSYAHLILGSTQWVKKLSEIFFSLEENYAIRTMSRFNPKELQDYDILVVGMHKTLGVFKDISENSSFQYNPDLDAFIFKSEDEQIVYAPSGNPNKYHTDYAMLAKVRGPNNNNIYIFSGIWDTGATQSLKNFTDLRLSVLIEAKMKSELGYIPEYYEVLFEVNGIDRMELSSKILFLKAL